MNRNMPRAYWRGVATVVGTTIGVGIFGVPFIVARSGFAIGLIHILTIGAALIMLNLMYAEVVLRTPDKRQFVGIVRTYLGSGGGAIATFISILNFLAALVAYIIVSGRFLHLLLVHLFGLGGSETLYSILFALGGAFIIASGVKMISKSEERMTQLLVITLVALAALCLQNFRAFNLADVNLASAAAPYGVILFALSAVSMVPLLEEQMSGKKELIPRVIIDGGIISIALTVLFTVAVLGITGTQTTPESLEGISRSLGAPSIAIGALFGFLAIATSYVVIGDNTKKVLQYDYKFPAWLSLILAVGVPLAIFLFGTQDFIAVIDASGSIFGGLMGITIVHVFNRARKTRTMTPYRVTHPGLWSYVLYGMFILGIVYQISLRLGIVY